MEQQPSNPAGADSWVPYRAGDQDYFGAGPIIEKEHDYIWRRRGGVVEREQGKVKCPPNLAAIALSGGGIRSASFGLGVLQALANKGWLKKIDYMSTVSGGGYLGSSLTWLLHGEHKDQSGNPLHFGVEAGNFPYGTYPMSGRAAAAPAPQIEPRYKGAMLRFLRQRAKYLTPGNGINVMSLVAAVLRGSLVSLAIYLALLAALFMAIGPRVLFRPLADSWFAGCAGAFPPSTNLALFLAATLAALLGTSFVVYSVAVRFSRSGKAGASDQRPSHAYWWRRRYEKLSGRLLVLALALLVVGFIPAVHQWIASFTAQPALEASRFVIEGAKGQGDQWQIEGTINTAVSGVAGASGGGEGLAGLVGLLSTLLGLISGIAAFIQTSKGKKGGLPLGLLVAVGTAALLFGVLLLAYHVSWTIHTGYAAQEARIFWWLLGAALLLGFVTNLNYMSIHRYYRDRLMETFIPNVREALQVEGSTTLSTVAEDDARLHAMCGAAQDPARPCTGPYHLINANVVLTSSKISKFRGRGGDNFILSPRYCGSNATGWRATPDYMGGTMTLATAMAISGAAVNPSAGVGGEGVTRQPFLSMLMGLLNIRLGYWAANPDPNRQPGLSRTPNYFVPGLWELLLRRNLNESRGFLQLSDGGHFENLALYEMIRRRARLIIVCDGAADPGYTFGDLANAMEKVRVDFGVLIKMDCDTLQDLIPRPDPAETGNPDARRYAHRGYLAASIVYPDNSTGTLLYLTTTFVRELSADLYGYRESHPEFPDEPTSDQFFDEKQFEAYRELGYQLAWRMVHDSDVLSDPAVKEIFP